MKSRRMLEKMSASSCFDYTATWRPATDDTPQREGMGENTAPTGYPGARGQRARIPHSKSIRAPTGCPRITQCSLPRATADILRVFRDDTPFALRHGSPWISCVLFVNDNPFGGVFECVWGSLTTICGSRSPMTPHKWR